MIKSDADSFRQMMNATFSIYGKHNPDDDVLRVWWIKLAKFEFNDITKAFDKWIDSKQYLPTPADIMPLCQHKVTMHARIASPLALESYKQHADNVIAYVAKNIKPQSDYRAWIKPILANPKNYPDISLKYAKEVAGMKG
jgi:hypothetical protein